MRILKVNRQFCALVTVLALLAYISPSWATVTANSIITTQTPKAYKAQITNASGTTAVSLITPGASGTKVTSIVCSNTDGSGYNVTFSVLRSSTAYVLGTVAIPASSGS